MSESPALPALPPLSLMDAITLGKIIDAVYSAHASARISYHGPTTESPDEPVTLREADVIRIDHTSSSSAAGAPSAAGALGAAIAPGAAGASDIRQQHVILADRICLHSVRIADLLVAGTTGALAFHQASAL